MSCFPRNTGLERQVDVGDHDRMDRGEGCFRHVTLARFHSLMQNDILLTSVSETDENVPAKIDPDGNGKRTSDPSGDAWVRIEVNGKFTAMGS